MNKILPVMAEPREDKRQFNSLSVVQWFVLLCFAMITVWNIHLSLSQNVAHDALPYMEHYINKFTSEGRWINFSLFEGLRQVPPAIALWLCVAFVFGFAYQIAQGVRPGETWLALCFGLLMVNVPYFTMLFKWPMTLLPATLMMFVFALLRNSYARTTLLLISGVVFFATYPAFYFLMPLLFIRQLSQESYWEIGKFLIIWMAGYVLGYIIAQGAVYLYTAIWTEKARWIEFASWRHSTPTTDLASLIANIDKSASNFQRNVLYLSRLSPLLFIPLLVTAGWALWQHTKYMLVVLLVVFSLYASVIALGVIVPLRSGVTLPIGMMMVAMLIRYSWARLLLLLTLFISYAYLTYAYNNGYNEKRILIANLLSANDVNGYLRQPQRFKRIVVAYDGAKTSRYFYWLTRAEPDKYKTPFYFRTHYIEPFLYKFGWKESEIEIKNETRSKVRWDAWVEAKGGTLYLTID
jgi:hypothetical protein